MKNRSGVLPVRKEAMLPLIILIGIAMLAPILFKQQLITGTIVNATLIIGVCLLGVREGIIICLVPSSMALAVGLLSPMLAPMVPFIIIGNVLLLLSFAYLKKYNFWIGIFTGSLVKFIFLYGTSSLVAGLWLNKAIVPAVAQMLSWPQLVTALAGGVVAFGVVKLTKGYHPER
jgi:riboflavin transporter